MECNFMLYKSCIYLKQVRVDDFDAWKCLSQCLEKLKWNRPTNLAMVYVGHPDSDDMTRLSDFRFNFAAMCLKVSHGILGML